MSMLPQILATVGGAGTRLYPLTLDQPKPLVELCDTAIIAIYFRVLAVQGCNRFILGAKGANNTLHLSNYFKAGEGFFKRLGITDHEDMCYQPLYEDNGSADSLRFCAEYFDVNEDLLVISGDNHIDIDINDFVDFHNKKNPILTVGLKEFNEDENVSLFGTAKLDNDLRIRGFVEKPKPGSEPSRMVNTSFYLFSPQIREVLKEMGNSARDIAGDLIPYLIDNGYPVYGYPIKGYWIDIGTPESLHKAAMDCLSGKIRHFDRKHQYGFNQWIHPSTLSRIKKHLESGDIELRGNISIGRNCNIEKGALIEDSHIGHTSIIDKDVEIKKSMIMSFANIKRSVRVNRAIIGRYTTIEKDCQINSNTLGSEDSRISVIGENVILPNESIVAPGVRVASIKYRQTILAAGRFVELGIDDKNIYFEEKVR